MKMTMKTKTQGFTLIELMIAVVIVSILVGIAVPSYQNSIQKSRRSDAKIALEKAAVMQEQHYFANSAFTTNVDNLGGTATLLLSPEGHYSITSALVSGNTNTYILTATALGSSPQFDDKNCRTFTLDNTGTRGATNSAGADSTALCY